MTVRRKVGEGTTVHERNVEAAIARVPQWRGKEGAYAPLLGGLSNQNWLVEISGDGRRYFVKVPGEGSEMFINRVTANEAARNAHAMGVGPEVIFFDAADGLEISEFRGLSRLHQCGFRRFRHPVRRSRSLSPFAWRPQARPDQDDLRHD